MTAINETNANDLYLTVMNDSRYYESFKNICRNLIIKRQAGTFEEDKAVKVFYNWVTYGAKVYCQEFGYNMRTRFPKKLRESVASRVLDFAYSEYIMQ